jgi:hypothetical protein
MTVFLLHFRTAWEDYFSPTSKTNLNSQTYTSKQTFSSTSVYVSNCLFKSITSSSGNGGALYYSSVTYSLVESTSFFSCKTSNGNGGAIYSGSISSGSVLHGVCGYDCCSTYASNPYYQFAYIYVSNSDTQKNYVNYSSITRCVNENSNSYYTLHLYYSLIFCQSVNSSLNKCYSCSGIFCAPYSTSRFITCSLTYSSFTDNIATGFNCIRIHRGSKHESKSCNILRNTQGSLGTEGTIYTTGNMMIQDSCILENKATYIFYQESSNRFTLSNCTVDLTSNNGYLTTQNTVTKSFILALNHLSTRNCHSEYDSAGYLSPIRVRFLIFISTSLYPN